MVKRLDANNGVRFPGRAPSGFSSCYIQPPCALLTPGSGSINECCQHHYGEDSHYAPLPDDLGNTPAICAKSYVHETVVNAFEDGVLEQFAERLRSSRSNSHSEKVLAQIAAQVKADAAA
jgi:hypothetical protein